MRRGALLLATWPAYLDGGRKCSSVTCTRTRPPVSLLGRHYGIDNFTETNKIAIVSVKMAFLQVADDNITETGQSSSLFLPPYMNDDDAVA